MKAKTYIGTSGYSYPEWHQKKGFYEKIKKNAELEYYAENFNFVEINSSFYREPSESSLRTWRENTPKHFVFSIKAPRYFTHIKCLNVDEQFKKRWKLFWKKCQGLRPKLAAILFQLPPMEFSEANSKNIIDNFTLLAALLPKRFKIVFEFRHSSWVCDEIYFLFKKNNWCFSIIHTNNKTGWAGDIKSGFFPMPSKFWSTASWGSYIRLHGRQGPYCGKYDKIVLKSLANKLGKFKKKKQTIFVAFNNTIDMAPASAIVNAKEFQKML